MVEPAERTLRENKKSGRGQNLSKMKLLTKTNTSRSQEKKRRRKKKREREIEERCGGKNTKYIPAGSGMMQLSPGFLAAYSAAAAIATYAHTHRQCVRVYCVSL